MENTNLIYTGTSGLVLPVPNKKSYPIEYQDKSRLTYYASLFNSIEINSSFYKLPQPATIKKWAESVPQNFRFTYKLWKEITHSKNLEFRPENVEQFMSAIENAGTKKGCLLIQLAPSTGINAFPKLIQLISLIRDIDISAQWDTVVEFRNTSWYEYEVFDMVNELGMSVVLHDLPASATPFPENHNHTIYVRFHGPQGGYRGSYPEDFLSEYAQYVKEWASEGKTVYVYFNNTIGDAVKNLMVLNSFLT